MLYRYPPISISDGGCDDVAVSRNSAALEKEVQEKGNSARKKVIVPLMKLTFPSRRQYILSDAEDLTVEAILTKHCFLSFPVCVRHHIS